MTSAPDTPKTNGAGRVRRALDRAIFASLLALTLLVAVPYGSVDPWWEGAFAASIFALGALWMIEGMLGGAWLVPEHRVLLPIAALILFAAAQTLQLPGGPEVLVAGVRVGASLSADSQETWRFVVRLTAHALALALLLRYTSRPRRLRALVQTVAGVGFLSGLFGFLRLVAGRETMGTISARLAANLDGFAQFINRNHFAFLAEMSLGAALGLLIYAGRRRRKLPAYIALALTLWTALVLSNSRGGIISMFVAIISTVLLYLIPAGRGRDEPEVHRAGRHHGLRRRAWRESLIFKGALLAGLLAATLVGVLWVGGERLAERLEAVPTDAAVQGPRWGDRRTEIWRAAWRLFLDHPLAGTGFGAFRAAVPAHHDASGEMSLEQAHNDYLELLAGGGLIGAALASWFVWMVVACARTRLRSPDSFRRAATAGALGGLLAVSAHNLFDFGLHVAANTHVLSALLAVVCAGGRVEGEPHHHARTSRSRVGSAGVEASCEEFAGKESDG